MSRNSDDSGWFKWGVTAIISLLAAGSSIVALLNYFQPQPPVPSRITRDFLAGRWEVQQTVGSLSGGTMVDYRADGTFDGYRILFVGEVGKKVLATGRWDFTPQSQDTFRLTLHYDTPQPEVWTRTFKLIDQDHFQNINDNYVAVRIK